MKLYINILSLKKFQELVDSTKYLQTVLAETNSNVYYFDKKEYNEVNYILKKYNIKFKIKN